MQTIEEFLASGNCIKTLPMGYSGEYVARLARQQKIDKIKQWCDSNKNQILCLCNMLMMDVDGLKDALRVGSDANTKTYNQALNCINILEKMK